MAEEYTRLYKYVSMKYVMDILKRNRLYLSDGSNFNDPFEITVTDRESKITKQIGGLHIVSLTNSFQNKLIWSHYSDSHKSVCLTVKVPSRLVYPICYSSKRVYSDSDIDYLIDTSIKQAKKNLQKSFGDMSREKKIAYIKDRKWMYEKEYRIVFDETEEENLIFENGKWYMSAKVTNVYLGVNFNQNELTQQEELLAICEERKIKVTQMELDKATYAIKVRR